MSVSPIKLSYIIARVFIFILVFASVSLFLTDTTNSQELKDSYNIDAFIEMVPEWIEQFKAGDKPGEYSYRPGMNKADLYGTTDMFYLLYTLDMLNLTDDERKSWAKQIAKFQDEKKGWFGGNVTLHSREHATAYAVGALKILGFKPRFRLSFGDLYDTPDKIHDMLMNLPWNVIWSGSHIGSGIASALINAEEIDNKWTDAYFDWLDKNADPETGYWMLSADGSKKEKATRDELGGAFHFYYIYTYLKQPLPYPDKIIEATISVQQDNGLYHDDVPYCIDLDGVFSIIRALDETDGALRTEAEESVEKTLSAIVERLNDRDFVFKNYTDSHKLVGAVVALAEIQAMFPEKFKTPKPLKRVLDESPFI